MKPKGLVKAFRMFEKRGINLIMHGKLTPLINRGKTLIIIKLTLPHEWFRKQQFRTKMDLAF